MSNTKTKFKLDRSGVREVLYWQSVKAECEKYASNVKSKAGAEYGMETISGRTRVVSKVFPTTVRAANSNKKHNTLLKSLKG